MHSAAADRNQRPILEVLRQILPPAGHALEVASGTGQHAAFFASSLPGWTWQPSDATAGGFGSVSAWSTQVGVRTVAPPVLLDVLSAQWPSDGPEFAAPFEALFCANMLHISPWATCSALMHGAKRYLAPGGLLITYGPYLEDDVPTAPGNLAFDQSLRQCNAQWGIRRREDVAHQAVLAGLHPRQRFQMPANNLVLVFRSS